jgi:four helix bundle protein
MTKQKELNKLETSKMWREAQRVAVYMYELIDELQEEERISLGYRLRSSAFDITSDISEAEGAIDQKSMEYALGMARKSLFGLKNAYLFLGALKELKIDPDIMVSMDKIESEINLRVKRIWIDIEKSEKEARL